MAMSTTNPHTSLTRWWWVCRSASSMRRMSILRTVVKNVTCMKKSDSTLTKANTENSCASETVGGHLAVEKLKAYGQPPTFIGTNVYTPQTSRRRKCKFRGVTVYPSLASTHLESGDAGPGAENGHEQLCGQAERDGRAGTLQTCGGADTKDVKRRPT